MPLLLNSEAKRQWRFLSDRKNGMLNLVPRLIPSARIPSPLGAPLSQSKRTIRFTGTSPDPPRTALLLPGPLLLR